MRKRLSFDVWVKKTIIENLVWVKKTIIENLVDDTLGKKKNTVSSNSSNTKAKKNK